NPIAYTDGQIVYFNPTTGKKCTNYTESQSKLGVNSGCMKWYVFNDSSSSTKVNLLLDHTLTNSVWTSNSSNRNGPTTALAQLKSDTSNWTGVQTPTNYTWNGTYAINYSGYKARLITAEEIAQITGNIEWKVTDNKTNFFDSNTVSPSSTCTSGNTTGCKYGWLYDRTGANCVSRGCLNNTIGEGYITMTYYWTASATLINDDKAWIVDNVGRLVLASKDTGVGVGVRPVIEVLKSKLY
ncbi:MAG: hypothetical protein NC096_05705, partial [Candidatus Amulumruptor caecigallinarius]|nr:hypothetical protein [Candidatus Amulumruptor caecigallinarius]